jgi:hypothetical protein
VLQINDNEAWFVLELMVYVKNNPLGIAMDITVNEFPLVERRLYLGFIGGGYRALMGEAECWVL